MELFIGISLGYLCMDAWINKTWENACISYFRVVFLFHINTTIKNAYGPPKQPD